MKRYKAIAEFYDYENAHSPMLEQDVPMLLGHLPRRRQTILELATGTARAAIPLAQAGHQVVGVDYDERMLAIARRKRDSVGISAEDLSFVHRDILKLRLNRKFNWVVLLFNTFLAFTTLEEQDALLRVVARHLKPGGKFWLDIFQPDFAMLAEPFAGKLDPVVFYVPHLDRTVQRTTSVRRDRTNQVQRLTFSYVWFDERGTEVRKNVEFDLTFIVPRELRILLERNGLKIEKMYGNYDESRLTSASPRMIAMCRRSL